MALAPVARHVWLDGRLVPSDQPHISLYDRAYQLGDAVFEAFRARRGVPIELAGHLARLHESAAALELAIPFSDDEIAEGVASLLAAEAMDGSGSDGSPPGDGVVRLVVTRGLDPTRSVPPNPEARPSVSIQVWPYAPPAGRVLTDGERLVVSSIPRDPNSPMAHVKTTSRADLVYARIEARRAGADDAIFLTPDGRVTEATTSNILVIRGDECATPMLSCGILAGTTRAWLVEHGSSAGLRMIERDVRLPDLLWADEVALCASIIGVLPVTAIEGKPIGDGRPGWRTMALRDARERWIDAMSRVAAATR